MSAFDDGLSPNPLLAATAVPPIAAAQSWVAGRSFPDAKPLIDVCQAVPGYPPAPALVEHLSAQLALPEIHRYAAVEGVPALRAALAADVNRVYGSAVTAENVLITAGCNQAYCLSVAALAKAGDRVILPLPYYFNYDMWLAMSGIERAYLAFRPDLGGMPDLDEAAAAIDPRTRALLLISPNNPTGAIHSPEAIRAMFELCRRRGIALILDETYRDFLAAESAPHDLFRDPEWSRTLIHLYSFSKVFSLTGHRVGAIVAASALIREIAKAMDCLAICAPRPGQAAAAFGLGHLHDWRAGKRQLMSRRLAALKSAFARNDLGYELVSAGAYFAYLKHPHRGKDATAVARRQADRQNLLALPGPMFGPGQEDYLRLAFANVEAELMPEIAARLAEDAGDA